jgi:SEC-C motif-containing protein
MDFGNIGRNDPCPCGSGQKFKRCHLGQEKDLITDKLTQDPAQVAVAITKLPVCDHPRAAEMAASLEITSPAGKALSIKLVDLKAYAGLQTGAQDAPRAASGGVLINPNKTRILDPEHIYVALSSDADDSTVIHQLAHAVDMISGSSLPPGKAAEIAQNSGVPSEFLEHPQEFGDKLMELAEKFGVELDAEDEIVAFLAERKMLLPGRLIAKADTQELTSEAEKTLSLLNDSKDEITARIKNRAGYVGS